MIASNVQSANSALVPPLAQSLRIWFTARTALRSSAWIDLDQLSTSFCRFVGEFGEKGRPPGIVDRLGQQATGQSFDIQIFHGNPVVAVDQFARRLVMKVGALVSDMRVRPLQQAHRFLAALRAFLSARHTAVLRQNSIRPVFSITSSGRLPLVSMMQSSNFSDLDHLWVPKNSFSLKMLVFTRSAR